MMSLASLLLFYGFRYNHFMYQHVYHNPLDLLALPDS